MSLNWQKLPHEVLYKIFSYLDRSSLVKCASLCQSWYASAGDELLWKRLLLSTFRLPSSTVIRNDKYSWKSELKRLIDEVPSVLVQDLTLHRDEVLHVNFSHDGSELVSCSKDNTFIVWTDKTEENDGKFRSIYYKDMLKYEWNHTVSSLTESFSMFPMNFHFVLFYFSVGITIQPRRLKIDGFGSSICNSW